MLQKKYSFNQSSVGLEITGLPDLSNDNDNTISIISQWKLSIMNQPEIEGNIDHLKSIITAFYKYSNLILTEEKHIIESKLIDIRSDNDGHHKIFLKSTKKEIKPLTLQIGNAELCDIVSCFDQLKASQDINLNLHNLTPLINNSKLKVIYRKNIAGTFLPPFIALLSISIISIISAYFYDNSKELNDNISLVTLKKGSEIKEHMIILK